MRKIIQAILTMMVGLVVAACGGSDVPYCGPGCTPTDGDGGGSNGVPSVVVSISTTTITSSESAKVTATVRDSKGVAQAGQVVSFSTNGGLGAFSAATALTGSDGRRCRCVGHHWLSGHAKQSPAGRITIDVDRAIEYDRHVDRARNRHIDSQGCSRQPAF